MADETPIAVQYSDRTSTAVRSVLVEIGQTLGSYRGKFVVIGGAVPWLLLEESDMQHVGTSDVDLSLNAEALAENDQYKGLVEALRDQGYETREELRNFRMVRTIDPNDGGPPIDVVVDFLRPFDAVIEKNKPPITPDFATQRAYGADLATHFYKVVAIEGDMPRGGRNTVQIAVASIPALLAMKGYAMDGRNKQKDAYDIYFSIRNFRDGVEALVDECRPLLEFKSGKEGFEFVASKFKEVDDFGPTCVRNFVADTDIAGDRSPDDWQQDAFGQVDAWARALGLR